MTMQSVHTTRRDRPTVVRARSARAGGFTLVELLMALAISAVLLTALTVALNASFHAYATAARSASTHASARLVMYRLLGAIRTSSLHEGYDVSTGALGLNAPTADPLRCLGIRMLTSDDKDVYI